MTSRPLRFGISLLAQGSIDELRKQSRRAEQIGFHTVLLPDHLGYQPPLIPLVAIAEAAPTVRVSNLVINASFYRPALLARDLASVDAATGGRLEIALGTGYVEWEFAEAGLSFPTPRRRVELLTEHVLTIRKLLSDPAYIPAPVQSPPPILVAGAGDKLLAMAAQHADTVAIASMGSEADLAERVTYVKTHAAERADGGPELAFGFIQVSLDNPDDVALLNTVAPDVPDDVLKTLTTYLGGSIAETVDRIQRLNEELGITYFTLSNTPGTSWDTIEKLMAALT
jgi:probable F420-dependent oxidoreductase